MRRNSSLLKFKFKTINDLSKFPAFQVRQYVRNLHQHIHKQDVIIRKLRRRVDRLKAAQNELLPEADLTKDHDKVDDDVLQALEKAERQQEQADKPVESLDVKAFVNDIKKTAEDFDFQNRYIYEPTSGLYYDPATGYYYNAIYGLHYDGQRGCYLKYNEESKEYEFYSQVMPEETQEEKKPKAHQKKRAELASAALDRDDTSDRRRRRRSSSTEERRRWREERDQKRRYWRSRSRSLSPSRYRRYRESRSRSRSRDRDRDFLEQRRQSDSYENEESQSSSSSSEEDVAPYFKNLRKEGKKSERKKQIKSEKEECIESDDNREEGELDSSDSESGSKSVVLVDSSSSDRDVPLKEFTGNYSDVVKKYPPSLRMIVRQTDLHDLREGSLFIVTYKGGSLGREGDHDVIIPDIKVSKYHLKFTYDNKRSVYQVVDLGSRNGTLLNGVRMTGTMKESDPFDIEHGDEIRLNQTTLLCHIHDGNVTCDNCEPGLLVKNVACNEFDDDRITKPVSYKEGLKLLQKRYGLEDEKYVEPAEPCAPDYKDRAAHRRNTKGSSNEHAKTVAASVDQHIDSKNKGFKMLSKLGWSAGQTLGKNDEGLVEPIPIVSNVGTSGLGSQKLAEPDVRQWMNDRKQSIWKLTQQRYKKCVNEEEKSAEDGSKTVPAETSTAATVHKQISSENKGFQLLSKLGWSEGQALGNKIGGLKEPIKLLSNAGTSGLGSKPLLQMGTENRATLVTAKKKKIQKKKKKGTAVNGAIKGQQTATQGNPKKKKKHKKPKSKNVTSNT
ncbi:angiogenic factor with G patch and FHA domains 1-like [Malaya genurostris]|uniref:angiogenic factor with G patch and FHA domains 1-like n=1 Tax=Malaya genurostris TaxID=325434 RepID=UPI0026F3840B|nr:angiogenic factor with G patch and FHA domains 1-like [Malaya genurostris]